MFLYYMGVLQLFSMKIYITNDPENAAKINAKMMVKTKRKKKAR